MTGNLQTRITFDPAADSHPVWSPDGTRIAFASARSGVSDLYVKSATGAGTEELLLKSPLLKHSSDWSRDGRWLVYTVTDPKTRRDVWVLSMSDRKPQPYLQTPFNESHAQLSPDGRFMAYESDESGIYEVYVRPFPDANTGKWQISSGGGGQPKWRPDGKELFYLDSQKRLTAAAIKITGAALERSTPVALFESNATGSYSTAGGLSQRYGVLDNGQRFVVVQAADQGANPPMDVVVNWVAGRK